MNKLKEPLVLPNIGICIAMDLVGMLSYILPGVAEFLDIIWAPISGYVFFKLFGGRLGLIGGVLYFLVMQYHLLPLPGSSAKRKLLIIYRNNKIKSRK